MNAWGTRLKDMSDYRLYTQHQAITITPSYPLLLTLGCLITAHQHITQSLLTLLRLLIGPPKLFKILLSDSLDILDTKEQTNPQLKFHFSLPILEYLFPEASQVQLMRYHPCGE